MTATICDTLLVQHSGPTKLFSLLTLQTVYDDMLCAAATVKSKFVYLFTTLNLNSKNGKTQFGKIGFWIEKYKL